MTYSDPGQPPASQPYGEQPAGADNPGKTLGIVGLILSIIGCTSLIGLIVSIVGMVKSRKAGMGNGFALAGIIVGAIGTIGGIIFAISLAIGGGALIEQCAELGPGTHEVDGVTYTCS
ncbi:DUF4190 domain-containing protein [Myceligenerans xiligouense]|uniref:DUF4190 domain-containing protein n=1 Tax=Myceligenerans xiligouense TaxID=253184 RepID=A0A3N4ZBA3_9MICO|nr:DUF4190 domain-containing protein [Myceligenerans xiligouense]RPF22732.1 hypothetical protein EDD34_3404 [Myceligenerans xiligouense]